MCVEENLLVSSTGPFASCEGVAVAVRAPGEGRRRRCTEEGVGGAQHVVAGVLSDVERV